MSENSDKTPDPKEIEKEIGAFLNKKFGGSVKVISPMVLPGKSPAETAGKPPSDKQINFDLKPEELVTHLDQYIVKQERAKAILATKICTHFNRIKHMEAHRETVPDIVGGVKSNILMAGPTGVGKTYMVKLIAKKIGVPFVKGDATKFSETGYVGKDVEDLVRDLVREADDDIELAQYGIIYIDEIDKIASSRSLIGADVSRTGVQRALLKPMEETDVELKVPHDPISMIQELDRFHKTGHRERRVVNTANILFIMSGAFSDLGEIIRKRTAERVIGFGSTIEGRSEPYELLPLMKSEDLVEFGFESEFAGRLPVRAIFEKLTAEDLFTILKSPSNPIILGKRLDFAAYGIDIKFDDTALSILAERAHSENTGARGLVSAMEEALLDFERMLPSSPVRIFPVTAQTVEHPGAELAAMLSSPDDTARGEIFERICMDEKAFIRKTVEANWKQLSVRFNLTLTQPRIDLVASYYSRHITEIETSIRMIKQFYDETKKIELYFLDQHDIMISLEEDAVDFIIEQFIYSSATFEEVYRKITQDFEYGLKLVKEKTRTERFVITREALTAPETFLSSLIIDELKHI